MDSGCCAENLICLLLRGSGGAHVTCYVAAGTKSGIAAAAEDLDQHKAKWGCELLLVPRTRAALTGSRQEERCHIGDMPMCRMETTIDLISVLRSSLLVLLISSSEALNFNISSYVFRWSCQDVTICIHVKKCLTYLILILFVCTYLILTSQRLEWAWRYSDIWNKPK